MEPKHYHFTSYLSVEDFTALSKLANQKNLEVEVKTNGPIESEDAVKRLLINALIAIQRMV